MIYRLAEQTGDTIVEVMVSIAVLTLVLVGAYITANRSLHSERDAQEHTQALTIAQGQIEDLHAGYQLGNADGTTSLCFNPTNPTISTDGKYCFENSAGQFDTSPSDTTDGLLPVSNYWYAITDSHLYDITLFSSSPKPITSPTYEVTVSWPSVFGGTGNVQLFYRPE
jgi:type II secretory pathway pseudopilin PulG